MAFFQELIEGLLIALRAIRANKMRSVLTTLGIIIGIFAVSLMAAGIDFLDQSFEKSAKAFGTDILYVEKWPWVSNEDWSFFRNRPKMEVRYANIIDREATLVSAVAPVVVSRQKVTNRNNTMDDAFVTGTTASYNSASGNAEIDGRFFSQEESDGGRPVCVIGATVAENLFPTGDPIGQTIRVVGFPYTILGVYEKQGGLFGRFTTDTRVFIPLHSFESHFGQKHWVTINVRMADLTQAEDTKLELEGIMRKIRRLVPGKPNNFSINAQEILTQTFGQFTFILGAVGLVITSLSLIVGGIGIMNIMFVSVTERTKEIGVRKALGAKRRNILFQFLVEAAALSVIGGCLGLLVAYIAVQIINQVLDITGVLPFFVVFVAISVSAFVGIVSGFIPAYRAAKLDPVEALRYE